VDKDPVPPLVTGAVLLGVLAALGVFATGWLPWELWPPTGKEVTGLLIASLVGALVAWSSLAYGIVITAAKVDDIREMLRAQAPGSMTSGSSSEDVE
jgi:protein-S-isoprenylcysteine O-methyltransferase Ste14